jgi:GNAT superfamily N-acetyltransferase
MQLKQESVSEAWDELVPLALEHHNEQRVPWPFKPKRNVYENCERAGILRLFTMRDEDGLLIGYQAFNILEHPHFDCRIAYQDTIYVLPEHRGFSAGKFLLWVDRQLAESGAQKIIRMVPQVNDWSGQLQRQGYADGDRILTKTL